MRLASSLSHSSPCNALCITRPEALSHPFSTVCTGLQRWKALMNREFLLIRRTIVVYKAKSVQIFVMGLCAATLFLRTHVHPISPNDGQEIAGFTFFGLLVILFNGIAEMSMAVRSATRSITVVGVVLAKYMLSVSLLTGGWRVHLVNLMVNWLKRHCRDLHGSLVCCFCCPVVCNLVRGSSLLL